MLYKIPQLYLNKEADVQEKKHKINSLQFVKALIPGKEYLRNIRTYLSIRKAENIILGAGETQYLNWVSTDRKSLNILDREDFRRYWRVSSRWKFLAEHVWEHFTLEEARTANANCFEFLKSGGRLRIAVPDGLHPDESYIEYIRPGGTGPGAKDHQILYNYRMIQEILEDTGFRVEILEYWDEQRKFHIRHWNSEDGHICRSKRFDRRNQAGSLNYTSLIVDGIKA